MTKNELQLLFSRPERPAPAVLSVYLNVDQSQQANLNRAFETKLNDMIGSIRDTIQDQSQMEQFTRAAKHISNFVSVYKLHARGLALFFDTSDDFFWHGELDFPIHSESRWDTTVFSQPLVNASDQFDKYTVILADRENLRVFAVFLGEIEECLRKEFGPGRTRHLKTAGSDSIGSASQLQRKADEQVRSNLRQGIAIIDSFLQTRQMDRMVLAGTSEITAELGDLLPKRLASCIIGTVNLPINTSPQEVLAAAQRVADEYERRIEVQKVDQVITAAAKTEKAVIGLRPTLEALNSNRAWQFIYSEGFSAPGFECFGCSALFPAKNTACPYCGGPLEAIGNVVERAVEQASRKGAKVEVVTGSAAGSLDSAGSIAAFLKTRTR